ncbi:hypothetical protein B0H11DRAFT_1757810 [Mycena galericulata]|nr:hypothetical protein B0H11DRAFT_1757810 [Mycena galericulata]
MKGFAPKGRPEEIKGWVKCARRSTPIIKDVASFAAKWKGWWRAINPQWRAGPDGGLLRVEKGGWEGMRMLGANGFLNVLICLKWWRDGDAARGDWEDSVPDVTWAIERLLANG